MPWRQTLPREVLIRQLWEATRLFLSMADLRTHATFFPPNLATPLAGLLCTHAELRAGAKPLCNTLFGLPCQSLDRSAAIEIHSRPRRGEANEHRGKPRSIPNSIPSGNTREAAFRKVVLLKQPLKCYSGRVSGRLQHFFRRHALEATVHDHSRNILGLHLTVVLSLHRACGPASIGV